MKRLRYDLTYLVSAALFAAATTSIVTGLVAHLWDLNEFSWHIRAGYVMTVLALAHVALSWRRLVNYAKFRLKQLQARSGPSVVSRPAREQEPRGRAAAPGLLSRRNLLTGGVVGAAGFVAGRGLRQPPVIPQGSDVGLVYHQWSKPGVVDALGTLANWGQEPPLYKQYPSAARLALPPPDLDGGLSTSRAIMSRRSVREYDARPMTREQLSRLLLLTGGLREKGQRVRTAPSSGALYPIELYPVVHNVEGLERGVYHYGVEDHTLSLVRPGDHRAVVVRQSLQQEFLGECNVVLFLTVIFQRMRFKYQDRTYRYGLLEAGHLGQNAYLAATSSGLAACGVGAFLDDEINAMLGVDGVEEAAVYLLAVGSPAQQAAALA